MKAHEGHVALVLSPAKAAETIGVPERTLEAWRWRRVGPPFVKLGKRSFVIRWYLIFLI